MERYEHFQELAFRMVLRSGDGTFRPSEVNHIALMLTLLEAIKCK